MYETYLGPFAHAVRTGTASVMCSHQRLNGSYGCQNSKMLHGLSEISEGVYGVRSLPGAGGCFNDYILMTIRHMKSKGPNVRNVSQVPKPEWAPTEDNIQSQPVPACNHQTKDPTPLSEGLSPPTDLLGLRLYDR